jgi:hypothetical protein
LVDGITCAFAGDASPSTIAAAGAGAILRPRRRNKVAEREDDNPDSITSPLGKATTAAIMSRPRSLPKKTS